MAVPAPVFRQDMLEHAQAFKLVEMPRGDLYLGEELVSAIRATGMTSGTEFKIAYKEHPER